MKKNIDNPIVQRILKAFNFAKLSELYGLIGTTSQNINGMINRGTLIKNFEVELVKRKINLDWVKTGQGNMTSFDVNYPTSGESPSNSPVKDDPDHLWKKISHIYRTDSEFKTALDSNINAFHAAINLRHDLDVAQAKLTQFEAKFEAQQNIITEMRAEIKSLNDRLILKETGS